MNAPLSKCHASLVASEEAMMRGRVGAGVYEERDGAWEGGNKGRVGREGARGWSEEAIMRGRVGAGV